MADLQIWRLRKVIEQTGHSRSSIYQKMDQGEFPQRISLGPNTVGWDRRDVIEWIEKRIEESRKYWPNRRDDK